MNLICCAFVLLVSCGFSQAQLSLNESEFEALKKENIENIERLRARPREEAIPELYKQLFRLNNALKCDETVDVLNSAIDALVSFPGYESFYKEKIDSVRNRYKDTGVPDFTGYRDAQNKLARLQYIRRPEVVAVLGYFLNDPEGRDGVLLGGGSVHGGDFSYPVNCLTATQVMYALRIENPPTPPMKAETQWEQVDAWKDWWNEIAAGKRTYRFIGSPIEYGPNGPVEKKVMGDRSHGRAERGAMTIARSSVEGGLPRSIATSPWAKIAGSIAVVLALTGAWFAFRKRPTL